MPYALELLIATLLAFGVVGRDHVLLLTTAVIVATLVVQGFTLGPLVRRSGIAVPPSHARSEVVTARAAMSRAALAHLDQEAAPLAAVAQLRRIQQARLDALEHGAAGVAQPALRQLRRDLIAIEAAVLTRLYEEGTIGARTWRQLQRRLDLEDASLAE